jgi:hypothetical protein
MGPYRPAWLALLITRFMVTIVPGRGLITTTPADRAIHPADQRRAIGPRDRAVPESDRLRRSTPHAGMEAGTTCYTRSATDGWSTDTLGSIR